MDSAERTFELLRQLAASKKNLADTLVSKGEDAEVKEPFDDLVQKAAGYIPKSYIFVDENGKEVVGTLVDVGRGRYTVEEFCHIVEARDLSRSSAGAPAQGLFLSDVVYNDETFIKITDN